ncbi:hypothetical protein OAM03_01870 [Verrucomicrobia bacterium]|nr:hypothetical protein [Verrucomicrobiota bacterium]
MGIENKGFIYSHPPWPGSSSNHQDGLRHGTLFDCRYSNHGHVEGWSLRTYCQSQFSAWKNGRFAITGWTAEECRSDAGNA